MKKFEIVKKREEFNKIIKTGKYTKNEFFSLYNIDSSFDIPRFGITVPTKLGNAVTRNKLKRRIKAIIDQNKFLFKKNKDYIIIVRRDSESLSYKEMEKQLLSLLE